MHTYLIYKLEFPWTECETEGKASEQQPQGAFRGCDSNGVAERVWFKGCGSIEFKKKK